MGYCAVVSFVVVPEMRVDISMACRDVDDLEHVSNLAEEDHIALEGSASHLS